MLTVFFPLFLTWLTCQPSTSVMVVSSVAAVLMGVHHHQRPQQPPHQEEERVLQHERGVVVGVGEAHQG